MSTSAVRIVGCSEERKLAFERDETGKYVSSAPLEESEKAFLDLELENGVVIQAEVAPTDFSRHVFPLLGQVDEAE